MFNTLTLEKELEEKTTKFVEELTCLSGLESKSDLLKDNNLDLIRELGFTNSRILRERSEIIRKSENFNEAVRKAIESLLFIRQLKDYFGESTILVKIEDFVYLIKKYNLVCGEFFEYLGIIPDKNLQEIKSAKDKIENIYKYIKDSTKSYLIKEFCNLHIYKITGIETYYSSKELKSSTIDLINSLPFILIPENYLNYVKDYLRLYLPEQELKKISSVNTYKVDSSMFIAAPINEMKNAKKSIRFHKQPKDPFICSLTSKGVVIYSKWGKEAEDKTLEKYNKLFPKM